MYISSLAPPCSWSILYIYSVHMFVSTTPFCDIFLVSCSGLKSFRSSPWDAKEWLPQEYSRVFAFENIKRAHK